MTMQSLHLEPKIRIPTAPKACLLVCEIIFYLKGGRHKKRPLDSVDLISQQNRLNLRCRFTPKERDMVGNEFVLVCYFS